MASNLNNDSLVFVYGTLRKGACNQIQMLSAECLGLYETLPEYSMFDLGAFPAVKPLGNTSIIGELYLVNQQTFTNLDLLEGYPTYYDRIQIDTPKGEAWMYVMNKLPATESVIESGDWIKYCDINSR